MVIIRGQSKIVDPRDTQYHNADGAGIAGRIIDTAQQLVGTGEYIHDTWKNDTSRPVYTGEVTDGGTSVSVNVGDAKPAKRILGMPDYIFYSLCFVLLLTGGVVIYKVTSNKGTKK